MVANKMTGEKGVLFTAAYITAFEAMRQHIQSEAAPKISPDKEERAKNAAKRLHIMELNAKSRAASQMQRLWNAAGIQPQYQALTLNGYLDGLSLPQEAFSGVCTICWTPPPLQRTSTSTPNPASRTHSSWAR